MILGNNCLKDWVIRTFNGCCQIDIIDYRGKTPKKLGGSWANYSGIIALSAMNVKQGQLVKHRKSKVCQ